MAFVLGLIANLKKNTGIIGSFCTIMYKLMCQINKHI